MIEMYEMKIKRRFDRQSHYVFFFCSAEHDDDKTVLAVNVCFRGLFGRIKCLNRCWIPSATSLPANDIEALDLLLSDAVTFDEEKAYAA